MAVQASGTLTVGTLGIQETLVTVSVAKSLQLWMDLSVLLAAGSDLLEVDVLAKVLAGGTLANILPTFRITAENNAAPIWFHPMIRSEYEYQVKVLQDGGGIRSIPWAVVTPD